MATSSRRVDPRRSSSSSLATRRWPTATPAGRAAQTSQRLPARADERAKARTGTRDRGALRRAGAALGQRHATRCSSSSRRWTPPARTRRSSTSCPASTRRASRSSRSRQPSDRGARPRLPVADRRARCPSGAASASSTARTTRRSSRSACIRSGSTSSAFRPGRGRGVLGRAIRRHQRLRTPPRPQRHEGRQVLPPRLEGGAEAALPRTPRRARARSGSSTRTMSPNAHAGTTT